LFCSIAEQFFDLPRSAAKAIKFYSQSEEDGEDDLVRDFWLAYRGRDKLLLEGKVKQLAELHAMAQSTMHTTFKHLWPKERIPQDLSKLPMRLE
jgi:hypothetical protein